MRIAEVIGKVTLSRCHPTLTSLRLIIAVPSSLKALREGRKGDGEPLVVVDQLGTGYGDQIGISEGAEGAAAFYPEKKPVDSYCCCILDHLNLVEQ